MSDEERIEQLELENKVLQKNNKGLKAKINELQKEIEELKEINNETVTQIYIRCSKKFKDKIKAKLEELENYYRELYKQDNSPNEFLIGQDCLSKLSILQEVKQSLLEKE